MGGCPPPRPPPPPPVSRPGGSHMDVVHADPSKWERDPFTLSVEGDRLYGRGTTDCLGHVALLTQFFKRLAELRPTLNVRATSHGPVASGCRLPPAAARGWAGAGNTPHPSASPALCGFVSSEFGGGEACVHYWLCVCCVSCANLFMKGAPAVVSVPCGVRHAAYRLP